MQMRYRAFTPPRRRAFPVAVVDASLCTACGVCAQICPVQAVTVTEQAVITPAACASCGACVDVCPEEAITMVQPGSATDDRRGESYR